MGRMPNTTNNYIYRHTQFFVENVITRHSVPRVIITDNRSPFQGHHIAQDSTKYSPFQLLYGHHPNMPINNYLDPNKSQLLNDNIKNFKNIRSQLVEIRSRATLNIEKAQERQKYKFEKRILDGGKEHKPPFQTGELVLKLASRAEVTPVVTIDDNYQGPYIVTKCFDNRTYALRSLNTNLPNENRIHRNKLKIYKASNIAYNPVLSIPTQAHHEYQDPQNELDLFEILSQNQKKTNPHLILALIPDIKRKRTPNKTNTW
ncbi:hypothetical protein BD560DRAFT_438996 [Blakeslea trispora]|nr:hypothetical protein BD560DRAFT_438996 [Blakeslea trispora]